MEIYFFPFLRAALPAPVMGSFYQFHPDSSSQEFLNRSLETSNALFLQASDFLHYIDICNLTELENDSQFDIVLTAAKNFFVEGYFWLFLALLHTSFQHVIVFSN